MEAISSKLFAKTAAARWKKRYFSETRDWASYKLFAGESPRAIYDKIVAAGQSIKKINEAVGNDSWTSFMCNECGESCSTGIEFENSEYTFQLCLGCLKAAMKLLKA